MSRSSDFFRKHTFEIHLFTKKADSKPELYGRYIHYCICATPSTREEINHFITAVNSLYPSLKYTCEISGTSLTYLDIKVSIESNGLCTSVHYKPTDSHSFIMIKIIIIKIIIMKIIIMKIIIIIKIKMFDN